MKTTATTTTAQAFPKLFNAIKKAESAKAKKTIAEIKKLQSVTDILNVWYYRQMLTKKQQEIKNLKEVKALLIDKVLKHQENEVQKLSKHLNEVGEAPELSMASISVEWKKNRTWGANPTAEARIYSSGSFNYTKSGSVGGCGYDKLSTAVANALNIDNSILKALYARKEKQPAKSLRDVFGYGSGYGILPRLEGGVGVSCYPDIFETAGYTFRQTHSGKTFDTFEISKGVKRRKK